MHSRVLLVLVVCGLVPMLSAAVPDPPGGQPKPITLEVPVGTPLRLYLTKRVSKRAGAAVEAKMLEPIFVFDREVAPAGAVVLGKVSGLRAVSKADRTRAIFGGDFTPLHLAPVEFTTIVMPDGRRLAIRTAEELGTGSIAASRLVKSQNPNASPSNGAMGTVRSKVQQAMQAQVARLKSIPELVRSPDKKERVEDYLLAKLPYHPQFVRKGTRFDAELAQPLNLGFGTVAPQSLADTGTQPAAGSVARVRLITPLNSASTKQGEAVEAELQAPLFSADRKLVLPEGTRLKGTVVVAKRARWFHRGGQLRFNFGDIELPEEMVRLREEEQVSSATSALASSLTSQPTSQQGQPSSPRQEALNVRTQASVSGVENAGKGTLKVDSEGKVEAKDPNTRFLAAAVALLIASRAADNDPIRNKSGQVVGQDANVGGRTVGGGFGFGLLGAAASQSSRYVGTAFGYYGLAWSLYSTLIARGPEVQFGKNAMIDVRFNGRR